MQEILPQDVRKILIMVYRRQCQYCKEVMPENELHVDHIDPRALGGANEVQNYTLACESCNLRKSGTMLHEPGRSFLLTLAQRKASAVLRALRETSKDSKKFDDLRVVREGVETCSTYTWFEQRAKKTQADRELLLKAIVDYAKTDILTLEPNIYILELRDKDIAELCNRTGFVRREFIQCVEESFGLYVEFGEWPKYKGRLVKCLSVFTRHIRIYFAVYLERVEWITTGQDKMKDS